MRKIIAQLAMAVMLLLPGVVALAENEPANQAVPGSVPPPVRIVTTPSAADPWAELAKGLPWPIAAVVIAVLLYKPLIGFINVVGGRITKLSLFKVELELKPAEAATTLLLDDLRTATTAAQINDSSSLMLQQIQSGPPAHYAIISLGSGDEWWTSRLYIAAAMMQRMRGVQVFVFVEKNSTSEQRLVAVASVAQLRWAMAQRYPWLELAWMRANLTNFLSPKPLPVMMPQPYPTINPATYSLPDPRAPGTSHFITSDTGAFETEMGRQVAKDFIISLQRSGPLTDQEKWQWQTVPDRTSGSIPIYERARPVTRELLISLLPQEARDAWVNDLRDASRGKLTRAVLRRLQVDFVALTLGDREFSRLANRRVLLENMAASLGEEPES